MPLDRSRGLLFVHIPKTAGTSIEERLGLRGNWQQEDQEACFGLIQSLPLLQQQFSSNFLQHLTLAELTVLLGPELHGCIPFTVVRDPWTRLISSFRRKDPDLCQLYRYRCHAELEQLDLAAFIEVASWLDHPHLRPQRRFLVGAGADQLDPRLLIFHQESLVDLERWLNERLGSALPLPHRNVNVPETRLPDLNPAQWQGLRQRVRELYAEDYASFGYA